MCIPLRIQSSTDYDKFQFIDGNRPTKESFIKTLVEDPSFPVKFPTVPLVVWEKTPMSCRYHIIDGQHRYEAAKRLKIPVYFMIDPTAKEDDIVKRNSQMHQWKIKDFIKFHASKGNVNYIILESLRNKYKVTFSFVHSVVSGLCGVGQFEFSKVVKTGKLSILDFKQHLDDFFHTFFLCISICNITKKNDMKPIYLDPYLKALCHIYLNDRIIYDRILEKIPICSMKIPYVGNVEDANKNLMSICKWRRPRVSE